MKWIHHSLAVIAAITAIGAHATEQTGATGAGVDAPVAATFQVGPVVITPGGFIELTEIYRSRNETADLASTYSGAPFPSNNNYYSSEYRATSRNTRLSLLADGPFDALDRVQGYVETDFVSAGITSNNNESDSYTLRLRQLWLGWARPAQGWAITAGQAWSLATLYTNGLAPRKEDIPFGNDGQYHTGFNWTRQPQFRFVKTFTPAIAVGFSVESAQDVLKGEAPVGSTATNPGGSTYNSTASYSTDVAPDVIVKLALDPAFGHFELYSLTRFLHERAPSVPGVLTTERNHTTTAESIGAGLIVPLWPDHLDVHATTLAGHGNGRYGSAQLGDATYDPKDGSISALHQVDVLLGLVGHVTPAFDLYAYAGMEQQRAAYGLVPADNTACDTPYAFQSTLPSNAGCGGVGTVRQVSGGFLWKFYRGRLGYLAGGPEIEYVKDTTYTAKDGTSGHTNDTMVYLTVRYYPFQK